MITNGVSYIRLGCLVKLKITQNEFFCIFVYRRLAYVAAIAFHMDAPLLRFVADGFLLGRRGLPPPQNLVSCDLLFAFDPHGLAPWCVIFCSIISARLNRDVLALGITLARRHQLECACRGIQRWGLPDRGEVDVHLYC